MRFHVDHDERVFRLSDLHVLELRFLKQAPLMADPGGCPEAEKRLYPDPLNRHREAHGTGPDAGDDSNDWAEFVVPGLASQFQGALIAMEEDLAQAGDEDSWDTDTDEIVVPIAHAEHWYSALNQARLVMSERFQLYTPPTELINPREGTGATSTGDRPRPPLALLTLIQYEFYGKTQCWLIDLFL